MAENNEYGDFIKWYLKLHQNPSSGYKISRRNLGIGIAGTLMAGMGGLWIKSYNDIFNFHEEKTIKTLDDLMYYVQISPFSSKKSEYQSTVEVTTYELSLKNGINVQCRNIVNSQAGDSQENNKSLMSQAIIRKDGNTVYKIRVVAKGYMGKKSKSSYRKIVYESDSGQRFLLNDLVDILKSSYDRSMDQDSIFNTPT